MERPRRAVLVGHDTARLLALAGELEARGLEVALYREPARGLAACTGGHCDVLVAIGRLVPRDGETPPAVAVPLVLLDAPDAPELALRPTGPRTVLGASVAPSAAADRVLALLARPGEAVTPEPPATPPGPEETEPVPPGAPPRRRATQVAVWVLLVLLGLLIGFGGGKLLLTLLR